MITQRRFGRTKDGREVSAFTLSDGKASATVLNYGGILQSLVVETKDGSFTDVLLGYNDVAGYEENDGYLGALIGRFGNRIHQGKLVIDGKAYSLYCNDKGNHLHGGRVGFNQKIWQHEIDGERLILSLFSPDGEENYPGNLTVQVAYTFQNGELKIEYLAKADKKTAVSLTNHAYFNLNGEGAGDIRSHRLWLDAEKITPTDEKLIPLGGWKKVQGTPFDFTSAKTIGRDIEAADIDLRQGAGYDHCFVFNKSKGRYQKYAEASGDKTGIKMSCYTDMPAVHFYTGNWLDQQGKTAYYGKRSGFCLETEAIPNNVNVPEYAALGNSILEAGEEYRFTAAYRFEIER